MRCQYSTKKSEMVMTISVGAGKSAPKLEKKVLEGGNHENHDHGRDDECRHDDRGRIKHGRLDLLFDAEDFFLVGGQARQQGIEDTGLLAGLDQIAVECIEIGWILAESLVQRRAGLDVVLDIHQEPGNGRVAMSLGNNIEGCQQRDAGFHHGGQLPGKQGHVAFGDALAKTDSLLGDFGGIHALTPQLGFGNGFRLGTNLATQHLAGLVLAFPAPDRGTGFLQHFSHALPASCYSLVTASISVSDVMPRLTLSKPA